jgi:hypothetical protein
MRSITALVALSLVSACQQETEQRAANAVAQTSTAPASEVANSAATDKPAPLAEPKGPIDPKSAEAAGQVLQHYGALIEQDRWDDAAKYWGDADVAAAFAKQLQSRGLKHLEIGKPGEPEGAAGSIYVTMPASFYGESNRSAANIILRRVNDVPGSTEAQRRWHIERIEWKA